jgi:chromosome segregation ATPase
MQALVLSKNRATKREMEAARHDRVIELERANAELRVELEQARLKIAEVEERQDSLCLGYEKLKNECVNLRSMAETLKQEKVKSKKTYDAKVAMVRTRFQYYLHHCKKLRDLRFNLEKAVNEFSASCLPYLRKGLP